MVSIKTSRLLLREFVSADWTCVHDYASDTCVSEYTDWGPNTKAQTKEFVRRAIDAAKERPRLSYELAITELPEGGAVIGTIALLLIGRSADQAMIGYVLNSDYWGKGIMSESAVAMLQFAFANLKLHRVTATCDPRNVASYRVMEKCGMRREGFFVQDKFVKGVWRDTLSYSILADEWARGARDQQLK